MGKLSVLECEAEEKVSELEYVSCVELDTRSSKGNGRPLWDARCSDDCVELDENLASIVLLTTVRDVTTEVADVTEDVVKTCVLVSGMLSYWDISRCSDPFLAGRGGGISSILEVSFLISDVSALISSNVLPPPPAPPARHSGFTTDELIILDSLEVLDMTLL